jgi:hypothetical protein
MAHNILSASEDTRPRGRWLMATSLVFFIVEALVLWHKSGDWYGLLVSLFLRTGSRSR